jgi:hypothetical protein
MLVALTATAIGVAAAQQERSAAPCTWDVATPLTVRGIDASETNLRGRCVRLRARLDGWGLYADRPHRGFDAAQYDFIGAYANDPALLAPFRERERRVEVLGVVGHCSDICADGGVQQDADGNTVICMATGFCHYYGDPYVMIEAVR